MKRSERFARADFRIARGYIVAPSVPANRQPPNGGEDSMQRYLLVMCIIAALILAAFKPARGALTGEGKCGAAKIPLPTAVRCN